MRQKEGVPQSWQAAPPAVTELPPGWQEMTDPSSGRTFYVNHITKTTTWDRPVAEQKAPPSYNAVAAAPIPAAAAPIPVDFYEKRAKPAARFTSRIVVGQKVRIKKQYQEISAKEIGTAVSTKPNGTVEVLFGRRKIAFEENEILEWLEPWGGESPNVENQYAAKRYAASQTNSYGQHAQRGPIAEQTQTIIFNEPRFGMEFVLDKGCFVISKIHQGFEAARKRVGVGMRMISIKDGNGDLVKGSTAPHLAGHMGQAPRPVTIEFATGYGPVQQSVFDRNALYRPRAAAAAIPSAYGTQRPYGAQQPAYGPQQPAYGAQQPVYRAQQPAYGAHYPSYGMQKPSAYGSQAINNRAPVAYQAPNVYQPPNTYQASNAYHAPNRYQAPNNNKSSGKTALAAGAVGLGAGVLGAAVVGSMICDDDIF